MRPVVSFTRAGTGVFLLVLALTLVLPSVSSGHTPTLSDDIHIAVLAYDDVPVVVEQMGPLVEWLQTGSPTLDIQLDVLEIDELDEVARGNQATVIITNPYHYLGLRSSDKLASAFATVYRTSPAGKISSLGGTIVVRSDAGQIESLNDLAGATVAIGHRRSTGGYLLPLTELARVGVSPADINWLEVGTQQRALAAVRDGDADAAFLRSSLLEAAIARGEIDGSALRVINRQALGDYPFAVSTRLYPEWPMVAVGATDPALLQRLLGTALLRTQDIDAGAPGAIIGIRPPADYSSLEREVRSLRLPPFDTLPEVTLADIWQAHRIGVVLVAVASVIIVGLLLALFERNRRLKQLWHDLRQSLQSQEEDRRRLADLNRHFEMFLDRTTDFVYFKDAGKRYIFASRAMADLTGHADRADMVGKTDLDVFPGEIGEEYVEQESELFTTRKPLVDQRQRYRRTDGSMGWVSTYKWPILSPDGTEVLGLFGISRDVTELHDYEQQLERAAHHDSLTGLPNRSLFFDRLHQAMAATERRGNELAVVYVDIDKFKEVNDELGHAAGDELLISFARLLSSIVRRSDTVARLGGDEFVLLLPDIKDREECVRLLDRLIQAMSEPQLIAGQELEVTVSAGLAFYAKGMPDDPDALLHRADAAMYEAKQSGRNQYRLHG